MESSQSAGENKDHCNSEQYTMIKELLDSHSPDNANFFENFKISHETISHVVNIINDHGDGGGKDYLMVIALSLMKHGNRYFTNSKNKVKAMLLHILQRRINNFENFFVFDDKPHIKLYFCKLAAQLSTAMTRDNKIIYTNCMYVEIVKKNRQGLLKMIQYGAKLWYTHYPPLLDFYHLGIDNMVSIILNDTTYTSRVHMCAQHYPILLLDLNKADLAKEATNVDYQDKNPIHHVIEYLEQMVNLNFMRGTRGTRSSK